MSADGDYQIHIEQLEIFARVVRRQNHPRRSLSCRLSSDQFRERKAPRFCLEIRNNRPTHSSFYNALTNKVRLFYSPIYV